MQAARRAEHVIATLATISSINPPNMVAKILITITAVDFLCAASCLPLLLSLMISADRITAGTPRGRQNTTKLIMLHTKKVFDFLLFLDSAAADAGGADGDAAAGSCKTKTLVDCKTHSHVVRR